jgi:hypothetical protein
VGAWKDVGGSQRSPLLCKEGRGEVDILPAYTNHGSPARRSLWMPLPLPASPYKGEESEGRPHKSLKSLLFVIAEVRTGLCNLNGPWTEPSKRNVEKDMSE